MVEVAVMYSAEIEQISQQENKDCDNSFCENTAVQAQLLPT